MTSEQWQQAKELYAQVEPLAANRRSDFLHRHCKDEEVCVLVAQMLEENVEDFLEKSPLSQVREEIEDESTLMNSSIGGYTLEKSLGQGGMGLVYLGVKGDVEVTHQVAIKLLRHPLPDDKRRFRRERKILASLNHPNIARLLDSNTTNQGLPYLVMEYVNGLPITEYCDQKNCSIPERLELFRKVCAAVQYAHRKLVIHRDLKPSNILVTENAEVKVLDFGIAKLINPDDDDSLLPSLRGNSRMTPEYASPEQLSEQSISTVSDVYSLGVLLYELLTGHRPYIFPSRIASEAIVVIRASAPELPSKIIFTGLNDKREHRTSEEIATARQGYPEALSRLLRGDLDNITRKALRVEPEQRYDSAQQLSEDIARYLNGEPVLARKPTYFYRTTRYIQRNKYAALMSVIAFSIAIAWAAHTVWRVAQERKQAREVQRKLYEAQIQQTKLDWVDIDLIRIKKTLEHWLPQEGEDILGGFEWRYLWGLVDPSDLTVTMPDEVFQAWHLPDEKRLYVRDVSGKRKVFDTVTGQELWVYQDQKETRATPDWPLNGEVIALEEGNRVVIWDVVRGLKKAEFTEADIPIKLVSQLDGTRIFTSDERGRVKIRERTTGNVLQEMVGTGVPLTGFSVISQSNALALITKERTVTVHFLDGSRKPFSFTEAQNIKALWPDRARQRLLLHVGDNLVMRDTNNGRHLNTLEKVAISGVGLFGYSNFLFLARNDHSIQILDANSLRGV